MFEQLRFCISNVSRYSMFGFGRDRSENVKILCGGRSGDFDPADLSKRRAKAQ